jgi:uncharacterized protein (DUF1810 family)
VPDDPYNLRRFVEAQDPLIERVRLELMAGRKASHWMWFVFPQIAGLGYSAMAQHYAISGRDEALAYLAEPVLSHRLADLTGIVNGHRCLTAHAIFGAPDDVKFHSSMTLFAEVAPDTQIFDEALERYFSGARCPATLELLSAR